MKSVSSQPVPAHAFTIDGQMGVNRDGTLKGYSRTLQSNTGAMHLTGTPSLLRGEESRSTLILVVLNVIVQRPAIPTSPAGAMRGDGAPQVVFAVESMLDYAATALGIRSR
ncbi:molybdopterin cofactor-binding domain-containing protein [Escherichia coli]